MNRRDFVSAASAFACALPRVALATGNMPAVQGAVGKMDGSIKAASTPEAARQQIAAGMIAIDNLIADFDQVSGSGGGDGVRRVLGTVGTASPLYLIEKAFRLLFDADDELPMEYIETVESLMQNLASADSEACARQWSV
jgi:hypothetical protein